MPNKNSLVTYSVDNHIATLTMNDPKTLNAFGMALKAQMLTALNAADEDDKVRVIVLQGAGGNFSSGGHIKEMLADGTDGDTLASKLEVMVAGAGEISRKLRDIEKPIIAKLQGAVAGAGMNLALTCDFRICAEDAKFIQAFVNIGLIPDAGGIYLLNQLLGAGKTTELVMLGDKLTAQQAAELNLVNQVVAVAALDEAVMALATRLSQLPAKALATMKLMMNAHAYAGLSDALDMEVQHQSMMARTQDFKEGIAAFLEKRKPNYQGE